jgi:hypothetical protein
MKTVAKNIVVTFTISVCIAFSASIAIAQGWGGGPVVVYDQRDGRGGSMAFGIGEYLNNRGQLGSLGNDRANSVEVANGYRVRFCEREGGSGHGEGKCEEFGSGYHNLRYGNMASYIRVTGPGGGGGWGGGTGNGLGQPGVTVYDDRNFRGTIQNFGPGRYLFGAGQFGALRNDEASSVVVLRGYRVRFCENEGTDGRGSGKCDEYGEGRFNLKLNDEASYIEVQRTGGWGGWGGGSGGGWGGGSGGGNEGQYVIVYSERDERGDQQSYGVGTYRNDLGQLGNIKNDDATSIFVPRGYRARLCEGEGGGSGSGRCEEYGPGSRNLRYNDKMSYIRVWRSGF